MEYAWVILENGRSVYRKVGQVERQGSDFPCPQIMSDRFDQPVQSMTDGKYYESKAALRRTYRADGNPQGHNYIEVGNTDLTKTERPKRDREADRQAFLRAEAEVKAGKINPKIITQTPDGAIK